MTTAIAARSRYIPWLFVAGFAVVISVNGIMMWLAIGSFSGLYSSKPRDTGLHYNAVIAEQKTRDALGWKVGTNWRADAGRLEVSVAGADGEPLAGARATVELVRPAEKRPPLAVSMGVTGPGRFAADIVLPERGNWDLDIVIEADGKRYAVTRRMFLR